MTAYLAEELGDWRSRWDPEKVNLEASVKSCVHLGMRSLCLSCLWWPALLLPPPALHLWIIKADKHRNFLEKSQAILSSDRKVSFQQSFAKLAVSLSASLARNHTSALFNLSTTKHFYVEREIISQQLETHGGVVHRMPWFLPSYTMRQHMPHLII